MISSGPEDNGDSPFEAPESLLPKKQTASVLDPGYYRHFNDTVLDFFNLTYTNDSTSTGQSSHHLHLQPSKITESASYYPQNQRVSEAEPKANGRESSEESTSSDDPQLLEQIAEHIEDDLFAQLPGCYWSAQEKDSFFNCLARFSIHRAEEFLPFLPAKSLTEIYAYYTLLKNELRRLSKVGYISDDENCGRVPILLHSRSVRYSNLATAHEVDEEFIEYEEEQSALLSNKEQAVLTKRVSRKNHFLRDYIDDTQPKEASLLENKELLKLSKIYRANQLFPILDGRQSCRLSFDSYVFLEKLVKTRTREILGNILANKAVVFEQLNEAANPADVACVSISRSDVWRSCIDLRLFETSMGHRTKYRDGKYPFLELYWQNLVRSLDVLLEAHQQALDASAPKLSAFNNYDVPYTPSDFFLHSPIIQGDACTGFNDFVDAAWGNQDDASSILTKAVETCEEDSEGDESEGSFLSKIDYGSEVDSLSEDMSDSDDQAKTDTVNSNSHNGKVSVSSDEDSSSLNEWEADESTTLTGSGDTGALRQPKKHKRSLDDCLAEDSLLDLEEHNLNLLDLIRGAKYLHALQKKFKLDNPTLTQETDKARTNGEKTILKNLNEQWDKSFAFY